MEQTEMDLGDKPETKNIDVETGYVMTDEEVRESGGQMLNRKQRRQLAKHKRTQKRKMDAAIKAKGDILKAASKYSSADTDFSLYNYILTVKDFTHCATAQDSLRTMYEYLWPTIARLTNQSLFMEKLIEDSSIDMSEEEQEIWNNIKNARTDMNEEAAKALEAQKQAINRKSSNFKNKIMS